MTPKSKFAPLVRREDERIIYYRPGRGVAVTTGGDLLKSRHKLKITIKKIPRHTQLFLIRLICTHTCITKCLYLRIRLKVSFLRIAT